MSEVWLYQVNSWWAEQHGWPHGDCSNISERVMCFVYRGTFNDGLRLIHEYQVEGQKRYAPSPGVRDRGSVTEYRLLAVTQLPKDTDMGTLGRLQVYELTRELVDGVATS